MRSARALLTSAVFTTILVLPAPLAHAAVAGDSHGDTSSSSPSRSHDSGHDKSGKGDHEESGWEKSHKDEDWRKDKPHGGVRTGSGGLALTRTGDWDPDSGKGDHEESGWEKSHRDDQQESGWEKSGRDEGWKKDKPHGGVHTGGGGLAQSGGTLAAGSLLLLGGAGAMAFRLRRSKAAAAA
ncbi:hypothetical protein ACFOOM_23360 [Streptomyces echinoruber]|uniref:Gram-positive cocci surface proteins LPxTG domain-containing protein n=1 Tax=Streptomyces echinoruber TaxID=68898 RepID=A0A918VDZ5_9ACTN|nr:hypothetical protein [Streptomyces echinoruber]GGZ91981.1 hypothetical protein GCM10010389_33180 [Streptomyces echinoruber]